MRICDWIIPWTDTQTIQQLAYGLPSNMKEKVLWVFITLHVVASCGKNLSKYVMVLSIAMFKLKCISLIWLTITKVYV